MNLTEHRRHAWVARISEDRREITFRLLEPAPKRAGMMTSELAAIILNRALEAEWRNQRDEGRLPLPEY